MLSNERETHVCGLYVYMCELMSVYVRVNAHRVLAGQES